MHAAHLAAQPAHASVAGRGAVRAARTGVGARRRPARWSSAAAGSGRGRRRRPRRRRCAKRCANASSSARSPATSRRSGEGDAADVVAVVEGQRPLDAGHRGRVRLRSSELCGHGVSRRFLQWRGVSWRCRGRCRRWPGRIRSGSAPMTAAVARGRCERTRRATSCSEAVARECSRASRHRQSPGWTSTRCRGHGVRRAGRPGRDGQPEPGAGAGCRAEPVRRTPAPPRPAPPLASTTPRPASSARRAGAGQPRRAVRARRPDEPTSTTAAAHDQDRPGAHPTTQGPRGPGDEKVPERHPQILAFACVCIRQRPESSGVKRLSTDRLGQAEPGHAQGHELGRVDVRRVRRPRAAGERTPPGRARRRGRRPHRRGVLPDQPGLPAARLRRTRTCGSGCSAARSSRGRLARLGEDWFLLVDGSSEWVVRHAGVATIGGLSARGAQRGHLVGGRPVDHARGAATAGDGARAVPGALLRRPAGGGRRSAGSGRDFFELTVGEGAGRVAQVVPNAAVAALQGRR